MKGGKRSSGFSSGALAAIAASAVLVLVLTLFVTHKVYTWISGMGDEPTMPAAMSGTLPSGQQDTTAAQTTVPAAEVTTAPFSTVKPEDLPGRPDPGASQTTAAATEATTAPPDTTEPQETTAPATAVPTDPPATSAPITEAPVTTTAPPETTAATTKAPTTAATTKAPATTAPTTTAETTVNPNVPVVNAHGIYSKAALLLDAQTGATIFSLDSELEIYPASLAKMMTAIVAIENHSSLDTKVTITSDMLKGLAEASASTAGFSVGETVTVNDLLHGLMLPSGADAANALAFSTAGSVNDFVALMNKKASELKLSRTNFTNTHGLHDDKQVSSCRDLATLLLYSLDNPDFRKVFTTPSYTTTVTEQHPKGITLSNAIMTEFSKNPLKSGRVIGSKTGFTTPAGQCLASAAVIGGREYILITVGAGKSGWNTARYNMLDAIELYGRIE